MIPLFYENELTKKDTNLILEIPKIGTNNLALIPITKFLIRLYQKYTKATKFPEKFSVIPYQTITNTHNTSRINKKYRNINGPFLEKKVIAALATKYIEGRGGKGPFSFINERNKNSKTTSCPYCGRAALGTIDHYLPQETFPHYSVYSYNLIPSCLECQGIKLSRTKTIKSRPIHPIIDSITLTQNLIIKCKFNGNQSIANTSFSFCTTPYRGGSRRKYRNERRKFEYHWEFFRLSTRPEVKNACTQALSDIRATLEKDCKCNSDIKINHILLRKLLTEYLEIYTSNRTTTGNSLLYGAMLRGFISNAESALELVTIPPPQKYKAQTDRNLLIRRR